MTENIRRGTHRILFTVLIACAVVPAMADDAGCLPPFPGERSSFRSYDRYDFLHEGKACIVVTPKTVAKGKPWIWRVQFFGIEPQVDLSLLEGGFHLVTIDVGDLLGALKAVAIWDGFYEYLTQTHGFARKAVLEGISRGGLIAYNWAAKNADKVGCIYADAPVCDFKSWPAGKGASAGDAGNWAQCLAAYGMTEEEALKAACNPIDNLEPLARAKVPLLHVVGDADEVVPVAENTAIVERRYKALGGPIEVIHKPGVGHHPHSLQDPAPIVQFILTSLRTEGADQKSVSSLEPIRERIEWCDIWITNAGNDALPRVLLIGDSIARGYLTGVEQALKGRVNCARLTTSRCICDPVFFDELMLVLRQYQFAAIHFNNGLHGKGYTDAQYRQAFAQLMETLEKHSRGARLIWATTTPTRTGSAPNALTDTEQVRQRNRIAGEFAARANLPVDDLFSLGIDHPEYYGNDGVHFNAEGRGAQVRQVSQCLMSVLSPANAP